LSFNSPGGHAIGVHPKAVDTTRQPIRRTYPDSYRRQVVAETWRGPESVSEVARRHDLNTNLLFKWRQRYPELSAPAGTSSPTLIPIQLTPTATDAPPSAERPPGRIALTLAGGHRLSLEGALDPVLIRVVLESLR
jgi:transposase